MRIFEELYKEDELSNVDSYITTHKMNEYHHYMIFDSSHDDCDVNFTNEIFTITSMEQAETLLKAVQAIVSDMAMDELHKLNVEMGLYD